jgi:hypothetical protein
MERVPFPDKLVTWFDLAKGIGEVVVESIFRMPRQLASHGEHFVEVTPENVDRLLPPVEIKQGQPSFDYGSVYPPTRGA